MKFKEMLLAANEPEDQKVQRVDNVKDPFMNRMPAAGLTIIY